MNRKLHEARTRKRWTIEKVCDLTGLSEKTYRRWEKGTHRPHYSSLELLCQAFEMTAEELGFGLETAQTSSTSLVPLVPAPLHAPPSLVNPDLFSMGIIALLLAQQTNGWTLEELRGRIDQEMRQYDLMGNDDITRREALKLLSGLPLALTSLSGQAALLAPEALALFSAGIPSCWKLYYTGGNLSDISTTIQSYISQLEPRAQTSTARQQAVVSGLLSQSYQLASMISLEHEDYHLALLQANRAIEYAHLSADPNIEAASLLRKATVFYYQKRYRQMSTTIQATTPLIPHVTPLLQARIYSELATDQALPEQDALRYLGQARDLCPEHPEMDLAYHYTHTSHYILHLNEEIAYTNLGRPGQALQALHKAETYVPETASTRGMELITHQATVAMVTHDLDLSCDKVESAILISHTLRSDLWLSDVERLYQHLQMQWRGEQRVRAIGERLQGR